MTSRSLRRAVRWVCAVGLVLGAGCRSFHPPDPFVVGRLRAPDEHRVRLAALYAVPSLDAVWGDAVRGGFATLPSGESARPLFDIGWQDALDDGMRAGFASVARVESLAAVPPTLEAEVAVEWVVVSLAAGDGEAPARAQLVATVVSRAGTTLWTREAAGEARGADATSVVVALRNAVGELRHALVRDPIWRRYEPPRSTLEAPKRCP